MERRKGVALAVIRSTTDSRLFLPLSHAISAPFIFFPHSTEPQPNLMINLSPSQTSPLTSAALQVLPNDQKCLVRLSAQTQSTAKEGKEDEPYQIHVMSLQEPRDNVRSERETDASIVLGPASDVLVRVGPKQVAEETRIGNVGRSHDPSDLLHRLEVGRETTVHWGGKKRFGRGRVWISRLRLDEGRGMKGICTAENLLVDDGGNGKLQKGERKKRVSARRSREGGSRMAKTTYAVEAVGEGLPELNVVSSLACTDERIEVIIQHRLGPMRSCPTLRASSITSPLALSP
jgi:hypothetical protein